MTENVSRSAQCVQCGRDLVIVGDQPFDFNGTFEALVLEGAEWVQRTALREAREHKCVERQVRRHAQNLRDKAERYGRNARWIVRSATRKPMRFVCEQKLRADLRDGLSVACPFCGQGPELACRDMRPNYDRLVEKTHVDRLLARLEADGREVYYDAGWRTYALRDVQDAPNHAWAINRKETR